MMFYDSVGPNPRVVRMFAAERGVPLEKTTIDLRGGENRQPAYMARNPAGQMPCLELADGTVIAEITAICEYLDEIGPKGATLIGATPEQRAECRMWTRRIDLGICEPMGSGFRAAEGRALFQSRMKLVGAEGAADLKAIAQDKILWLDSQMGDNEFVCGNRLTLADFLLFGFLKFGAGVGQPIPEGAAWIKAWYARMADRPSTAA